MKRTYKKVKGSLISLLMRTYIGFSFIFLVSGAILLSFSLYLVAFPNEIGKTEQYKSALETKDFDEIDADKLAGKGGSFQVYNQKGHLIYSSSEANTAKLSLQDLDLLGDIEAGSFIYRDYTRFKDNKGQVQHLIKFERLSSTNTLDVFGYRFELGNPESQTDDYLLLDDHYQLLSSNMENSQSSYSKQSFRLLTDQPIEGKQLRKLSFTSEDQERLKLVLFIPVSNTQVTSKEANPQRIWFFSFWILIALYFLLALFFSLWLKRRVDKPLYLLNKAMTNLKVSTKSQDFDYSGPKEFVTILDNFGRMADNLKKSEMARDKAEIEKRKMLADISHDLKTPITVIQGYSKAVNDGLVTAERRDKYLETIYHKAANLNDLINAFYDYSQFDHPDFRLEKERLDFICYLRDYLNKAQTELELQGYGLDFSWPNQSVLLEVDVRQFNRVLDNLLSNFTRYNPVGSQLFVKLTLTLDEIRLTIADDGIGISGDEEWDVFAPFTVRDQARTSGSGSGLGLAVVKRIVEAHGGHINLVSPPSPPYQTQFLIAFPNRLNKVSQ